MRYVSETSSTGARCNLKYSAYANVMAEKATTARCEKGGVKSGIEAGGDEEGRLRWAADEGGASEVDLSRCR